MFILEFWYARIQKSAELSKNFCKLPFICITIRPQNKVLQEDMHELVTLRIVMLELWIFIKTSWAICMYQNKISQGFIHESATILSKNTRMIFYDAREQGI